MQRVGPEHLSLFDLGPDMRQIREASEVLKRCTRSQATRVAYACDWRAFEAWCVSVGRPALPASADTVSLYVTAWLGAGGVRASTAARLVAAVAYQHRAAGLAVPDRSEARAVIAGAQRQRREQPEGKAALTPAEVRAICGKLQRGGTVCGSRDRALLTLGFAFRWACPLVEFGKQGRFDLLYPGVDAPLGGGDDGGDLFGVFGGHGDCGLLARKSAAWAAAPSRLSLTGAGAGGSPA
jgi:hypothetical protein